MNVPVSLLVCQHVKKKGNLVVRATGLRILWLRIIDTAETVFINRFVKMTLAFVAGHRSQQMTPLAHANNNQRCTTQEIVVANHFKNSAFCVNGVPAVAGTLWTCSHTIGWHRDQDAAARIQKCNMEACVHRCRSTNCVFLSDSLIVRELGHRGLGDA